MTSDMFRTACIVFASASVAHAQGPLGFVILDREADITAEVQFDDQPDDCSNTDVDETIEETMNIGFFGLSKDANAIGGGGAAHADIMFESVVESDRIEFTGNFTAQASLGNACRAASGAVAALSAQFTVSRQVDAALTGRMLAIPQVGFGASVAPTGQVILSGFSPTGGFLSVIYQVGGPINDTEANIFEPVTLYPDATYALAIGGGTAAGVEENAGPTVTPPTSVEMTVVLSLGDADEDGLLDEWEVNGIDIDEDGTPEIDLPSMGANPFRKDLFVEIDTMLFSSPVAGALDDVRNAFADVPRSLISNPDGSGGITLHTMIDETNVPPAIYPAPPGFWPAFAALKDQFYGTPTERASPKWEQIKEARLKSFRYCIWGASRADGVLGAGEIGGDDFAVMPGLLDNEGTRDEHSGIFMHEFGHNLGLRHGGGDNDNNKPNYISVMNYPLTVPSDDFPQELRDAWRLDYSRAALSSIDEMDVFESQGFGDPTEPSVQGRRGVIFAPKPGMPTQTEAIVIPLDRTPVDINQDNDTVDVFVVDLNRDVAATVLDGFNDWTAITLPLSSDGSSGNFGDNPSGAGEDSDELPGGSFSIDIIEEIADAFPPDGPEPCNIADLAPPFGITDLGDIDAFIPLFLVADPGADFVPPVGIVDLDDLDAFIAAFLAGCP